MTNVDVSLEELSEPLVDKRRYPSTHDCTMRLSGTIVRYKKDPIFVRDIQVDGADKYSLLAFKLSSGTRNYLEPIDSEDPQLDISSVPLGYIYRHSDSAYMHRLPERKQRQGVDPTRILLSFPWFNGGTGLGVGSSHYPEMDRTIRGNFREFEEAFDKGAPFSREFAVHIDPSSPSLTKYLGLMGKPIGVFLKKNRLALQPDYKSEKMYRVLSELGVQFS